MPLKRDRMREYQRARRAARRAAGGCLGSWSCTRKPDPYNGLCDEHSKPLQSRSREELAAVLEELGISESEAARRLGVTASTLNRWVSGRVSVRPGVIDELKKSSKGG